MTELVPASAALQPLKVRKGAKHDWAAIRLDYVILGATRKQAIEKYEVPARLFDYHAKKGDWLALKLEIEERFKPQLKGLPQVSDAILAAVSAQWRQRFRELEQMAVYIQRYMAAHGDTLTPAELNRLTQAERNIVQMQRLLMGESTENVGLVDKAVEQVLVIVERYVPQADRERFRDDIARAIRPNGLLPAPAR